jgi:hypothetical protein
VTDPRLDYSRFITHLTRDDFDNAGGASARENFERILDERTILAVNPHCLYHKRLNDTGRRLFRVACFTETPLDQLHHLVGHVPGRRVELAAYGFVFRRPFVMEKGAQEVTYINGYGASDEVAEAYNSIFEAAQAANFRGKRWKILPFVSAQRDRCHWTWERELRVRGDFNFEIQHLQHAILPDDEDVEDLRRKLIRMGVSVISPGMTYEAIAAEMSQQMRRLKRMLTPKPKVKLRLKRA